MQTSITARFSLHSLRTSFRRSLSSSSTSSRASSVDRSSLVSHETSSPVSTVNSIILRRKSLLESQDEDERLPHILEPRPAPTFCSLEERLMSF